MQKLKLDTNGVVIGSHTLVEYKFQVLNFMNMLWDNIMNPNSRTCMTVGVVTHNLCFEMSRVGEETNISVAEERGLVEYIRKNINNKSGAIIAWNHLLKNLTKKFDLKYDFR